MNRYCVWAVEVKTYDNKWELYRGKDGKIESYYTKEDAATLGKKLKAKGVIVDFEPKFI